MDKRIYRIGYIEFKDGRKVDIINTYSLPDGDIEIIAVDGLYRFNKCVQQARDHMPKLAESISFYPVRNNLYKIEAYPDGSYEKSLSVWIQAIRTF